MAAPSPFELLPNEAFYKIINLLDYTSPASLYKLLFIKACRGLVEKTIYRSVTLKGPALSLWQPTRALIDRILDGNDVIAGHIRHLAIEQWSESGALDFDEAVLERILVSLQSLHSFSWNSTSLIPKGLLALFHSKFPDAQLHVSNIRRGQDSDNMVMDLDLLASPQLYSLTYVALMESNGSYRSELGVLSRIIERSKKLRILRLNCQVESRFLFDDYSEPYSQYSNDGAGRDCLDFHPSKSKSLPPLQELTFMRYGNYAWTLDHCFNWKICMDWTQLTTLDLSDRTSQDFLQVFTGAIPNLKSLAFMLYVGVGSHCVENVAVVRNFLDSIKGLEELKIHSVTEGLFPDLWKSVKKHAITIRSLHTSSIQNVTTSWTNEFLTELCDTFPLLDSLTVDLKQNVDASTEAENMPMGAFAALCHFTHLRNLSVNMILPTPLFRQGAIEVEPYKTYATSIFQTVYMNDRRSPLEYLTFSVERSEYAPISEIYEHTLSISVKRQERDDAPNPAEGEFLVGVKQTVA